MTDETPSLTNCILFGAVGFAVASLFVFATVAFAERPMYSHLGLLGAYVVWTTLFILLGGVVFGSLVRGKWKLPRFYLLYTAAFFAYAAGWVGAYFILRGLSGEWVGSLVGSILMAVVFAAGFGAVRQTLKLSLILFVTHSVGYFLGSALNNYLGGPPGMLLWGLMYGLFFGGGIGASLQIAQREQSAAADSLG